MVGWRRGKEDKEIKGIDRKRVTEIKIEKESRSKKRKSRNIDRIREKKQAMISLQGKAGESLFKINSYIFLFFRSYMIIPYCCMLSQ